MACYLAAAVVTRPGEALARAGCTGVINIIHHREAKADEEDT